MNRRKINQLIAATLGLSLTPQRARPAPMPAPGNSTVKPNRLRHNDLVSLISPGSFVDDESLEGAVNNLETLGFRVKMGKYIREEYGYIAGSDRQRLKDLHAGFEDQEVKAVWCVRGGYGCTRLLPDIDFELIRRNPKILIGYSDITALLNAIYLKTGLVGFHGPVGASKLTDYNRLHLEYVLIEGASPWTIVRPSTYSEKTDPAYNFKTIRAGQIEGILLGGNLSLLAAMAGTGFLPDFTDHLLFLEDVGEKPYRVDRMLTQLMQSSNLTKTVGIAMGIFADCEPDPEDRSLKLSQTLDDRMDLVSCPVAYGLPFGHVTDQCTLPVGIRARLDANRGMLTLLEPAVI